MKNSVGFVGGGQMAHALAAGAINAGVFSPNEVTFAELDPARREFLSERFPESTVVDHANGLFDWCTQIILAVKPHVLKAIGAELKPLIGSNHLMLSIAAGISLATLRDLLGTSRVVRVMPNTPCQVAAGAAAFSAEGTVNTADIEWVERFFGSVGLVVRIPDASMHAFTGVAGSSPAYAYVVIEALSDGGVAMGLPRETATRMAAQAVLGAAKMVLDSGLHPGQLKDQVTSPGGTTIEALRVLEGAGTRSAFMEAVCTCAEKSRLLG